MRRDRINSCNIEQLKVMAVWRKNFHQQDPNTKLEKADILEMTVVFLKQQLQSQISAPQKAHCDGYSQCWRETVNFLSANSKLDVTLQHFKPLSRSPESAERFPSVATILPDLPGSSQAGRSA
ncbi:Transcription factor HES-5 [Bagarius yarrelli]|uniref:Transcription factor HES-5 n=1 Tax=Bagarius yarrelli TaxID=175774 RepID=A0A556V6E0_BAGYA|nr:Transcription factor HES-5 [Bagarius yarrelli]